MRIVLSRPAQTSLREIACYIGRDNKHRAKSFVLELQAKIRDIAYIPLAFPLVPRYEHLGIRRRPFGAYLIFYRVERDQVFILQILHSARDYEALLLPDR
jgi:toxin ParE1/3/4